MRARRDHFELQALSLNVRARRVALVGGVLLLAIGVGISLTSALGAGTLASTGPLVAGVALVRFAGSPIV